MKKKTKIKDTKDKNSIILNILRDLESTRKKVIEEKEKTSAIIENLTDGLIILDEKENIIRVNSLIENIFSVKARKMEGKNIRDFKGNPLFSKILDLVLDKKEIKEVKRVEFSPEEKITLEINSLPIISKGEKRGYLLIFHDISRKKFVEKLKTEFVTLAAHQLRTPLSGIKWTLKMLLKGDIGKLTEEQKEFLKKADQSNDRMIKLIDDLLDVTKIEEGRYLYYVKKENIIEVVEEAIEPLKEKIKTRNLKFKFFKPAREIPELKVDREKIAICVENLLVNAITYTNPGGKVTADLKYDKNKKEVVFSVQDTGMGIPKDQQKRIFTKFYRSTAAMKAEAVGSGLGLYMTKNIIEAHKGRVWFESEEGKGSTFYLALPTEEKE